MIRSAIRYLFLLSLSTVLAPTTVLFGGLPMRVLWRGFGRRAYWAGLLAVSALMIASGGFSAGIMILSLAVLIGVYCEVEDHGSSTFSAGLVSILASLGVGGIAVGGWLYQSHTGLMKELRAAVDPMTAQVAQLNPSLHVTTDSIVQGLPSGTLVMLMLTLSLAAICEPGLVSLFKLRRANYLIRAKLTQFQAPDFVVWILIGSAFAAFFKHGQAAVAYGATQALYVLATIYFFQGLAVVVQAFRAFRVSPFWQILWYTMIVLQLFLFVSVLGLVDYWLDFRLRLARKPAEQNKEF